VFVIISFHAETPSGFFGNLSGKQSKQSYLKLSLSFILIDNISNYLMKSIDFHGSEVPYKFVLHKTGFERFARA